MASPPALSATDRRGLWLWLAAGASLSLVLSIGMALQLAVIGSNAGEWVYGYIQPFRLSSMGVFLIASAAATALMALPLNVQDRYPWLLLPLWIALALALQWLLRGLTPFTLTDVFESDDANAFNWVAGHFDARDVMHHFNELRASWPMHAQNNMPGKVMLVYALDRVRPRTMEMASLIVGVSNLGAVLMYWFTRSLLRDARVALWAAVLYLFVPAKLYFFPLMNVVSPVLALLSACLLQSWLRTPRAWIAALFGVSVYGLAFFEPQTLALGLLFAGLIAFALGRGDVTWRTCASHGALAVVAFVGMYAVMRVVYGFDLISTMVALGREARAFNVKVRRPYAVWVFQNPIDFAVGIGVCQALLVGAALSVSLSASRLTRLSQAPAAVLCLSLVAVLAATDLIGVNRGEIIRLWIFLACFFQIPAAYVCARLGSRAAMAAVLATTILQSAIGTAMVGFVIP